MVVAVDTCCFPRSLTVWEPKAPQQLGPFPLGMPCALSVDPLPPSAPGPQPGASAPLPAASSPASRLRLRLE